MSLGDAARAAGLVPDRELKGAGRQCQFWDCAEPDPRHAVVWRCPAGHRETSWYCAGHIGEMTAVALREDKPGYGRSLCPECLPALVFLSPVTEPARSPRCEQCGHWGNGRVL